MRLLNRIRWALEDLQTHTGWWARETFCRIFGHSKVERRMREDICSRCRIVLSYR